MRSSPVDTARFYLRGLTSLYLGHNVSQAAVDAVLERNPPVSFPAGRVIFQQGEPAGSALMVLRGRLEAIVATPDGPLVVGESGAWEVVVETALYAPDQPRSATVRASQDSTALVLTKDDLSAAADDPVVAALEYHLLHTLAQRIRATNQAVEEAWRDLRELTAPHPSKGDAP